MGLQTKAICALSMLLASMTGAWAVGTDSTMISGANVATSVRVNSLACLEAELNIGAYGIEIVGIVITLAMLIVVTTRTSFSTVRWVAVPLAMLPAAIGLCAPWAINLLVTIARDSNLLS